MIALPPLFVGAVNATVAVLLPGVPAPMVGAAGATAVIANVCETCGAAAIAALPGWLALIVQLPAEAMMIFRPAMVHTVGVVDVSTTTRLELAVAPEANGVGLKVLGPGLANVIVWLPPTTVNVKLCVAGGLTPFVAVIVNVEAPVAVGVPESTPAAESETPAGGVPVVMVNVGAGEPEAVTLNVPNEPAVKVVDAALVIFGAALRLSVKPA